MSEPNPPPRFPSLPTLEYLRNTPCIHFVAIPCKSKIGAFLRSASILQRRDLRQLASIPGRAGLLLFAMLPCLSPSFRASVAGSKPLELRERALQSFQNYVAEVEKRNNESLQHGSFLWIDELSEPARSEAYGK